MKLFTQRRGAGADGEREAIDEPLLVTRHPEKARELIRLGARPKKYRHIADADVCFALLGVDDCLSALRSVKRGLDVLACADVEHLPAESVALRARSIAEIVALAQRVAVAIAQIDSTDEQS